MPAKKRLEKRRRILSWALYDWANSAFTTTVMAAFFPLFFKKYWAGDLSATESTSILAYSNSLASFLLAISSPVFGAIADEGSFRKKLLGFFTLLGALSSVGLAFVNKGEWLQAAWLYSLGVFGFTAALTFYDALLVQITNPKELDKVSALGYSLGYLGGGLLLAVNVWMYFKYGANGIKASFFTVGVWWLVFSLPLFLFVPEMRTSRKIPWLKAISRGFSSLHEHLLSARKEKALLFFLLGYFFYIDGVNTIVKLAVDYGLAIGLEAGDLIKAILMVQFVGFPSAIAFGYLGDKIGPVRGIWICLITYLAVTILAYSLDSSTEFFILAAMIGIVQGGIQSLSRSFYGRLVPPEESAQYFGFFNMVGKFSSILGPLFVGLVGQWTGSSRLGILVLTFFFVTGGWFLSVSQRTQRVSR